MGQHLCEGGEERGRDQEWPEGEGGLQRLLAKVDPSVVPGV